jgi:lipoprotein-anchoring transpeptidase ErfK/SrfK
MLVKSPNWRWQGRASIHVASGGEIMDIVKSIGHQACVKLTSLGLAAAVLGALAATPALASQTVSVPSTYPAGMIIIKQSERKLYFTTGDGTAIRYPVAIGKTGKAWRGQTFIEGKFIAPAWSPPESVLHDHPELPPVIASGAANNPMGAAALTLKLSEVAIHGTSAKMRASVGTAASYGCIRMLNEDVVDLFDRVKVGTPVVSIP